VKSTKGRRSANSRVAVIVIFIPRVALRDKLGKVADNFTWHLFPEERACINFCGRFLAVTSHGSKCFTEIPPPLRGGALRCMLQEVLVGEAVVLSSCQREELLVVLLLSGFF
jgi:hypothetical protein